MIESKWNNKNERNIERGKMREEVIEARIRTEERGKEFQREAQEEINRIIEDLNEDSLQGLANAIFSRSLEEKLIENRTFSDVIAASVYAACRIDSLPHTLQEIAEKSHSTKKTIGRTYAQLSKRLDLKVGPIDPRKFIEEYCKELELSDETTKRALDLVAIAEEENFHSGRSQSVVAASSIYIAAQLEDEFVSQNMISRTSGVNKRTIREVYQKQISAVESELTIEDAFRLTDKDLAISKITEYEGDPEKLLESLYDDFL